MMLHKVEDPNPRRAAGETKHHDELPNESSMRILQGYSLDSSE
jgi:hypothetical protein